ncbi:MAG: two-component system response regulator [Syntrophus sp. (in: bacteria)]|nr:two-component system response regulator [Syntrophus sp. (in: bacteria)]
METPHVRRQILVVEDSTEVRRAIVQILETEHYVVQQAEHGKAALKKLEGMTPDLILSDINMPLMNGIEFYKELRKNPRWTPIPFIFLTANDSPEDIQAGRELGVEDYLLKPIDYDDLLKIVSARLVRTEKVEVAHIGKAYLETVTVLANTIEGRDPYTHGHVSRVVYYARSLAMAIGWKEEHLRILEIGALMHDIGKIIVPDHILNKAGKLTQDEWKIMRQHPVAGAKILQGVSHLNDALPYIYCHHEHWDGSGYPQGLSGKNIPIEGRLMTLSDVYDALTTTRPYHPARPKEEVFKFLQFYAGKHFDPDLVPIFIQILKGQTD